MALRSPADGGRQPLRGADRRHTRRARGPVPVPARRDEAVVARADEAVRRRTAQILLECYERYGPIFTVRLFHSNVVFMLGPAANHYVHGLPRLELPLAGGALPRPDRADGRRAADDRRGLSPQLPADHAAGISPRAPRGVGRDGDGGDRARAGRAATRRDRGPVRAGPGIWRCGSPCGRCSAWTPMARRPARSTPRRPSRRRSRSTPASTCCACSATAAARGRGCSGPPASWTR